MLIMYVLLRAVGDFNFSVAAPTINISPLSATLDPKLSHPLLRWRRGSECTNKTGFQ